MKWKARPVSPRLPQDRVFEYLKENGIDTGFQSADRSDHVPEPLLQDDPARNRGPSPGLGSYLKRFPQVEEGTRFNPLLVEFFLKDDANHDPQILAEQIILQNIMDGYELGHGTRMARRCFELLEAAWARRKVVLVDMKIEVGRHQVVLLLSTCAIDNDSWRLSPKGKKALMKDKQVYRNLPKVTPGAIRAEFRENYEWVAEGDVTLPRSKASKRAAHGQSDVSGRYQRAAGVDIRRATKPSPPGLCPCPSHLRGAQGPHGRAHDIKGGFSGLLDIGAFCMTFNSDGVGTKALVAHRMGRYETLGYNLVAMVADDACCLGAEPTSMVNTLDIERVDSKVVDELMTGLESAARVAGCAVVGGEIADPGPGLAGLSWSASLIGIVKRERVLDGTAVKTGHHLVGLLTDNWRANGFSLVRRILENRFGADWHKQTYDSLRTWGDVALEPSLIFTPLVSALTGGFEQASRFDEGRNTELDGVLGLIQHLHFHVEGMVRQIDFVHSGFP